MRLHEDGWISLISDSIRKGRAGEEVGQDEDSEVRLTFYLEVA